VRCQYASPRITNCIFEGNDGRYGALYLGSMFTSTVRGCVFRGNGGDIGGAVYANGALGRFADCSFEGNAAGGGGAVYLTFRAETRFDSCSFVSNEAEDGGAVYSMNAESRFEACTFWGNAAERGAAVFLNRSDNPPEFHRCSLVANDGGAFYSLQADAVVTNTIVAFDRTGPVLTNLVGDPLFTHCFIFGNAGGDSLGGHGADNLFVDPLLCWVDIGDVTLCSNSECLEETNPWGEAVGARGQGCGSCLSPVQRTSWGVFKARYRTRE